MNNEILQITVIIILLSFNSYSQTQELDEVYINCVEKDIIDSIHHILGNDDVAISFFDSIAKFESFLIEKRLLLGRRKNDYKDLILKLRDNKNDSVFEKIYKEVKNRNVFLDVYALSAGTNGRLYDHCLNKLISFAKEKRRLIRMKITCEKIYSKGYVDIHILKELNKKINFKSRAFRLSFCNLIYRHLYAKYDENAIKRRNIPKPKLLEIHKN